jgi:hypothetical protein
MSTSFYGAPTDNGEQGPIELYDKLLRSACSLAEMLGGAGRTQSKSDHEGIATPGTPQSGCDVIANEILPRSEIKIAKPAGMQDSSDSGIARSFGRLNRIWHGKLPSIVKETALMTLCLTAIASASIAGFSIMLGGRNTYPTTTRVQSDIGDRTDAVRATAVDASREPIPLIAQWLSAAPTGWAETAPEPEAGQPNESNPLEATPEPEATATASARSENMSEALPSRAPTAKTHEASNLRRHAEPRRRVRHKTPKVYPQSVYYGQTPGSYSIDFDWGYSYGGPAPHSDTGN